MHFKTRVATTTTSFPTAEAKGRTGSASYGSARGEGMAPILGSQVCLWLAQEFDGIIRDPRGDWYEPTDGLDFKRL